MKISELKSLAEKAIQKINEPAKGGFETTRQGIELQRVLEKLSNPYAILDLIAKVDGLSAALEFYSHGSFNYYPDEAREALAQFGADVELK